MKKFSMIFAILATIALLFVGCDDGGGGGGGGSDKSPGLTVDLVEKLGTSGSFVVTMVQDTVYPPNGYTGKVALKDIFGGTGSVKNTDKFEFEMEFTAATSADAGRDVGIDFTNTASNAKPSEYWSSLTGDEGLKIEDVKNSDSISGEDGKGAIVITNANSGPAGDNYLTFSADMIETATEELTLTLTFTKFVIIRNGGGAAAPWVCACPTCNSPCDNALCTEALCADECGCECDIVPVPCGICAKDPCECDFVEVLHVNIDNWDASQKKASIPITYFGVTPVAGETYELEYEFKSNRDLDLYIVFAVTLKAAPWWIKAGADTEEIDVDDIKAGAKITGTQSFTFTTEALDHAQFDTLDLEFQNMVHESVTLSFTKLTLTKKQTKPLS